MRCFIAIKPPFDIAKDYYEHITKYKFSFNGNIVKPENIHITLFFFNNLTDMQVNSLCVTLDNFSEKRVFKIKLEKYDCFYRNRVPTVCFVKAVSNELINLRQTLSDKLYNLPFDNKPFKAHLTLARIKKILDKENFNRFLGESVVKYFYAQEVLLIKSELTNSGPKYSILHNLKLMR